MAKLTLNTIGSRYASVSALNANFDLIETALENTLSRDGTTPNTMAADLDLNNNDILNVATLNGIDVSALDEDINTIADNIDNVNTVAASIDDVNTLAAIDSNITTVAGIAADVTTVASISADVSTVAANDTNITAVAGNEADIGTVVDNLAAINVVASNINTGVINSILDYGSVLDTISGSNDYGSV